jgi:hypothetical protein
MIVYNTQYHSVCRHCPAYGILNTRKLNVLETDPVFETLCFLVFIIPIPVILSIFHSSGYTV